MDLHRISGQPEWVSVAAGKQNVWQRVAVRTHGIVTIGNFFSVLGLLSIPYALLLIHDDKYITAIIIMALGRVCDVADGWLANKSGTKSPLGEKIDASFDKISTGAVVIGLVVLGVVPLYVVSLLVVPHAVIALVALMAFRKGTPFHPSLSGKFSMAAIWGTILAFVMLQPLEGMAEDVMRLIAYGLLSVSFVLGVAALTGYIRELKQSIRVS